jgi:integral membrane sensor domain MASE1
VIVGEDRNFYYSVAAVIGAIPGAILGSVLSIVGFGLLHEHLSNRGAVIVIGSCFGSRLITGGVAGATVLRWWYRRRERLARERKSDPR